MTLLENLQVQPQLACNPPIDAFTPDLRYTLKTLSTRLILRSANRINGLIAIGGVRGTAVKLLLQNAAEEAFPESG